MTKGMELSNKKNQNARKKKETYKYFVILEVDTIKQVEMKEKKSKSLSQENEKITRNQIL